MGQSYMEDKFREPIDVEDGLYITNAQLEFFLNRPNGVEKVDIDDPEFEDYYDLCQMYNAVYDSNETDQKESYVFWNHKKNRVSIAFTKNGKLYKFLKDRGFSFDYCELESGYIIL